MCSSDLLSKRTRSVKALPETSNNERMTAKPEQLLRREFRGVLEDAINTLERTRHAFRSKELGELRKRLKSHYAGLSELPTSGKKEPPLP